MVMPENVPGTAGNLALASSKETVSTVSGRFFGKEFDELDHQVQRHRAELQGVDGQIAKLEESIDLDQKRLKALKEEITEKSRIRSRLAVVRGAMAKFIEGLQARSAS